MLPKIYLIKKYINNVWSQVRCEKLQREVNNFFYLEQLNSSSKICFKIPESLNSNAKK